MQTVKFRLTKEDKEYIKEHIDDNSEDVAEWIGCCSATVRTYRRMYAGNKNEYRPWTDSDRKRLQRTWNDGYPTWLISQMLGRDVTQIRGMVVWMRKRGWKFLNRTRHGKIKIQDNNENQIQEIRQACGDA